MHIANLSVADALKSLKTTEVGLSAMEAQRRMQEFGPNCLQEIRAKPQWRYFLGEFTHFFALILWIAAALAIFAESRNPDEGMWQLAIAIMAVILINGCFSFWQEYRAEQAIASLRKLLPQYVKVMREGRLYALPVDRLVPGDIVLLAEGDNIPADCRLIEGRNISVNTATITGESVSRPRWPDAVTGETSLDTGNLLLAGTAIVSGQGKALVFATGMHTEFGKIAHLTQTAAKNPSYLQQEIARLSRLVALFATGLGLTFFVIGTLIGLPFWVNLMFAIGIIVANVPEGLLPTVTLALAMATQRMAKRNALVRHLPAVETLGATTVICSDKTGTMTQNCMRVEQFFAGTTLSQGSDCVMGAATVDLLRNARYCHSLKLGEQAKQQVWLGDPMEVALLDFAMQHATQEVTRVISEIPFDNERCRMSVVVEKYGMRWLYCKGAPETVLPLCVAQTESTGECGVLDDEALARIQAAQEQMADSGLRVLAFAYRQLGVDEFPDERELVFSGLIGLQDPPRPEVHKAILRCHSAGIKVIMLTGDHPHTGLAIARAIGLVRGATPTVVIGEALKKMTASQLQIALENPEILFARVSAEQKMQVVDALKRKGEIVAVTGDGVNDAPALKSAHIGIAMGLAGTDVAKAAADMVLLDDNFASIVNAVEEGRAIFENIRKFLTYILSSNVPELIPYLAYVLFRIPLPLTVIQILAVDLGTDMLPALALGAERPDPSLMQRPPRPANERLLSWPLLARAYLWLGLLEATVAMLMFFAVLYAGGWHYGETLGHWAPLYLQATTACLAGIVMSQMVNVFVCRHSRQAASGFSLKSNPLLLVGVALEAGLLLLIIYSPLGNHLFSTQAFPPVYWGLTLLLALSFGALEELRKYLVRRHFKC